MGAWKNPAAVARLRDIAAARNRRAISYAVRIGEGTASVASIAREEGVTHSAIGLILQRACPPFIDPPPKFISVASNEAAKSDKAPTTIMDASDLALPPKDGEPDFRKPFKRPKPEVRPDWTRPDPALLALARETRADIEREWGKTRIAKPSDDAWTDTMIAASQPEEPRC